MTDDLQLRGDSTDLNRALDSAVKAFIDYQKNIKRVETASVNYTNTNKRVQGSISALTNDNRRLTTSFEQVGGKYKILSQEVSTGSAQQQQAIQQVMTAEQERARRSEQAFKKKMAQLRLETQAEQVKAQRARNKTVNTQVQREEIRLSQLQVQLEQEKIRLAQIRARTEEAQANSKLAKDRKLLLEAQKRENAEKRRHQAAMQASRREEAALNRAAALQRKLLDGDIRRRVEAQKTAATRASADQRAQAARERAVNDTKRLQIQQERLNQAQMRGTAGVQEMAISFQSLVRILLITSAYRAFFGFVNVIRQGVTDAIEFQRAVAGVQTIAQESAMTAREWADGLQRVSDGWRLDILEQTEAAYQTLTNQVAKGVEVFGFLEDANRFATAAFVDTNEAVRIGASAINAMRIDVQEANAVFASFFKTIELGRIRGSELTEIGRVLLPAKQLGVELNEVQAAMTTLTIQGVKANEAMTFLRGIFQKIIKPTERMKDLFAELGVESGNAAIETFGLSGFLNILEDRFKGSASELGDLFNRIRALAGIFGLSGRALEDFDSTLEQIRGSTESFNNAVELVQETAGEKLAIQLSRARNILIRFGDDALNAASDATNGFSFIETAARSASVVITTLLVPALGLAATAVALLTRTMLKSPFGLAIAGATALAGAFAFVATSAQRANDRIRASLAEVQREQDEANRKILDNEIKLRQRAAELLTQSFRQLRQNVAENVRQTNLVFGLQNRVLENSLDNVRDFGKFLKDEIASSVKTTEQSIQNMRRISEQAIESIAQLRNSVDRTLFDWDLEQRQGEQALQAIDDRIAKLGQRASILGPESLDEINAIFSEQRALLAQRKQLTDTIIRDNEKIRQERIDLAEEVFEKERENQRELNKLQTKLAEAATQKDRLDIQEEIREKEQEIQASRSESQKAAAALTALAIQERDAVQDLVGLREQQAEILRKTAREAEEIARKEEERLAKQKAQQESFDRLFDIVSDAKVKDILDLGDPKLIQGRLEQQEEAVSRLIGLAKELGVEFKDIDSVVFSAQATRAAIEQQLQRDQIKKLQEDLGLRQQGLEVSLERNREERSAAEQSIRNAKTLLTLTKELAKSASTNPEAISNLARSLFEVAPTDTSFFGQLTDRGGQSIRFDEARNKAIEEFEATAQRISKLSFDDLINLPEDQLRALSLELSRLANVLPEDSQQVRDLSNLIDPAATDEGAELIRLVQKRKELNEAIQRAQALVVGETFQLELQLTKVQQQIQLQKDQLSSASDREKAEAEIAKLQETEVSLQQQIGELAEEAEKKSEEAVNNQERLNKLTEEFLKIMEKVNTLPPVQLLEAQQERLRSRVQEQEGGNLRANGGAIGQDRIKAMLSPGEFVMSREATSQFHSQLVSMNSGLSRMGSQGGTQINGDFNINVTSTGNNQVDAIGIGRALRREVRRGTVKLQ